MQTQVQNFRVKKNSVIFGNPLDWPYTFKVQSRLTPWTGIFSKTAEWPKDFSNKSFAMIIHVIKHLLKVDDPLVIPFWLVVSTPLNNISQSVGMILPDIWKNKQNVPNHQPAFNFPRKNPRESNKLSLTSPCLAEQQTGHMHFSSRIPGVPGVPLDLVQDGAPVRVRVQLLYKWLNSMVYGRYNELVHGGYI